LSCSLPRADGPNDDFCCFAWTFSTTTCHPDNTLNVTCDFPAFVYSCAAGDNPMNVDSSLTCSTPVPSGSSDLFCCQ
jgi:hypothetical protein